jgi:hypothetical protein
MTRRNENIPRVGLRRQAEPRDLASEVISQPIEHLDEPPGRDRRAAMAALAASLRECHAPQDHVVDQVLLVRAEASQAAPDTDTRAGLQHSRRISGLGQIPTIRWVNVSLRVGSAGPPSGGIDRPAQPGADQVRPMTANRATSP